MKPIIGVYLIVNRRKDVLECYVGSSKNVVRRWLQHRYHLKRGTHTNDHLQAAWNKHGSGAFWWRLGRRCASIEEARQWEQLVITTLPKSMRLNIAERVGQPPCTPETRLKMRLAKLGTKQSPEVVEKRISARRGKPLTAIHKARIGVSNSKHSPSPEVRARISLTLTGRTASEETKAKRSSSLKAAWARRRAKKEPECQRLDP